MNKPTITEAIELAKKAREEKGIVPEKIDMEEREVPLWKLYDFNSALKQLEEWKEKAARGYWKGQWEIFKDNPHASPISVRGSNKQPQGHWGGYRFD